MIRHFAWSSAGQIGLLLIQLSYGIIIARLVEPAIFGVTAVPLAMIALCRMIVEGGIGGALIQDKHCDNTSYSSVFLFTSAFGLFIGAILFVSKRIIASWYELADFEEYITFVSATVVLYGLQVVFNAYTIRSLQYKLRTVTFISAATLASFLSIYVITKHDQAGGILLYPLINSLIISIVFFVSHFRLVKSLRFSWLKTKPYLHFGVNTSVGLAAFGTFEWYLQSMVLSSFGPAVSGIYMQSKKFTDLQLNLAKTNVSNVLYSILAKDRPNDENTNQIIATLGLSYFAICVLLLPVFPKIVLAVLGEAWHDTRAIIPPLIVLSFVVFIDSIFRMLYKLGNLTKDLRNLDIGKFSILSSVVFIVALTEQSMQMLLLTLSLVWFSALMIGVKRTLKPKVNSKIFTVFFGLLALLFYGAAYQNHPMYFVLCAGVLLHLYRQYNSWALLKEFIE